MNKVGLSSDAAFEYNDGPLLRNVGDRMNTLAFRTDGKGNLNATQEELPQLGTNDVRVAIRAVALNFRDLYCIRGNSVQSPLNQRVPCTDAVGIVEDIGSAVTRFRTGDRVCSTVLPNWVDGPLTELKFAGSPGSANCDGVLAERVQMSEEAWIEAPADLTDFEAATLPVAALTAWHAICELGALKSGDNVVVQTTGGVAIFALQFALAMGARAIVASRSPEKLQRASHLGAAATIDTSQTPEWDAAVLALTSDKGAELILDMGLSDSLRRSARAAAFEATVAIVGVVQERSNLMDIFPVMNKNLRVRGVETGSRSMFERMIQFMRDHQIRPIIDSVFSAPEVDLALDRLGASPFGKVVVDFSSLPRQRSPLPID